MTEVWDFEWRPGETLEDGNDRFIATVARTSLSLDEFQVRRAYCNLHGDVDHESGISIATTLHLIVKTAAGDTLEKLIQVVEKTQDARGSNKPSRKKKNKSKSKDKDARTADRKARERKPCEVIAAVLPDPDPALPADPILATMLAEFRKVAAQVACLDNRVTSMEAGPLPAAPAGNATSAGAAQGRAVQMVPGNMQQYPRPWSQTSCRGGGYYVVDPPPQSL